MNRLSPLAILLVLVAGTASFALPPANAQDEARVLLTGVVRDDAGNPLGGVDVSGSSSSEDGRSSYDSNVTAADGSYALRLAPGKAYVSAWLRDWNRGDSREVVLGDEGATLELTIKAPPPKDAAVAGLVTDHEGRPLAGARVTIGQGCCYYATDAQSKPAVATAAPTPAPAEPADEQDADAAAESGGGSTGSAGSDDAGGVSESKVAPIWCCSDYDYQEAKTDENGRYEFLTYPGARQVTAYANGYAQSSVQVDAVAGESVGADLRLEKIPDATAILKGRVVDAKTGLPVANAHVSLSNLEWSRWNSTVTGPDGAFSFQTIPGWVQVSISGQSWIEPLPAADGETSDALIARPASAGYKAFTKSFALVDGESTRDFPLVPKDAPTFVLTGYVVDPDTQKGVAGAWINVWNQDTGDWGSAQADADGSYRILVRPGYHQVSAYAEGHLGATDMVDVAESVGTTRLDLFAPKGTTKYAPCDDCYDAMYAERGYAMDGGAGAPSAMPTAPAQDAASAETSAKSAPTGLAAGDADEGTRASASSYTGGAGGLGPYDANDAAAQGDGSSVPAAKNATSVPGFGVAALAAAAGVVALAARGRRRD